MAARFVALAQCVRDGIGVPAPHGRISELARELDVSVASVSRWYSLSSSPDDPSLWPRIEAALDLPNGSLAAAAFATTAADTASRRRTPSAAPTASTSVRETLRRLIQQHLDATTTTDLEIVVTCAAFARAHSANPSPTDPTTDPDGQRRWAQLEPTLGDLLADAPEIDDAFDVISARYHDAGVAWQRWDAQRSSRAAAADGDGRRPASPPARSAKRNRPTGR